MNAPTISSPPISGPLATSRKSSNVIAADLTLNFDRAFEKHIVLEMDVPVEIFFEIFEARI